MPAGPYQPLTGKERRILWAADTFASDGAYIRPFLMSIGTEIAGYPKGWNGFTGYLQRSGTAFVAYGVANSTQSALQAMFHHEPRYVPCKCTGITRRALHAMLYSIITLNDDGHKVLNISPYIGAYAGSLAVQGLFPGNYDVWQAMRHGNSQLYYGWIFNEIREFAPDLAGMILFRKHKPKAAEPANPGSGVAK